jgi:hypothetical protein
MTTELVVLSAEVATGDGVATGTLAPVVEGELLNSTEKLNIAPFESAY